MNRRDFTMGMMAAPLLAAKVPAKMVVYVGTYTERASKGIYQFELDMATGALKMVGVAAETPNPSFLALAPGGKHLYSVGELEKGTVNAWAIDRASGKLTAMNSGEVGGGGTCHLKVSPNGKFVLAANYGTGSVAAFAIETDGRVGKKTAFQQHTGPFGPRKRPHAHSVNFDKKGKFALVADLGKDAVIVYQFDSKLGTLAPHNEFALSPGSGPRHFAFHPNAKWAYVINEIKCTMTAAAWDDKAGKLTEINTEETMPIPVEPRMSTAEVVVHPNGRFVYGSNRGHDSIAIFSIDGMSGRIARIGNESTQGKVPRNFNIDPSGKYLIAANQGTDSLMVFGIDGGTGKLTPIGKPVEAPVPVCVKFLV